MFHKFKLVKNFIHSELFIHSFHVYIVTARDADKKILKTTLLRKSRSKGGTKENRYFGLQVSFPNPNSLCTPYAATGP